MLEKDNIFSMFSRIGLCLGLKIFHKKANWVAAFGVLNLFKSYPE